MLHNEMEDYVLIRDFESSIVKYSYFHKLKKTYFFEFPEQVNIFVKPFKDSMDTWDFKLSLYFRDLKSVSDHTPPQKGTGKVNLTIESYGELITLYRCFPTSARKVETPDHMHNLLIIDGFINASEYRYQRADYKNQEIITRDITFLHDYKLDNHKKRLTSE